MNGFERLKEQIKDQEDIALKQTVDYLLSREDMEQKYLNEEKSLKEMAEFIRKKGTKHLQNGWNYITNEVVYAWAIMYFSLPNKFLQIEKHETKNKETKKAKSNIVIDNVVSLEEAKKQIKKKEEVAQITLFGGAN